VTKQTDDMLGEAYTDALLYGVGIIKIVNTLAGPRIAHVPREEFLQLSKHLNFVVENTLDFTDIRSKR
jgi:hypothetical protein